MTRHILMLLGIILICITPALPTRAQETVGGSVTARVLHMRTGPAESYPTIAELPYGTQLTVHARSTGGYWLLVQATGAYGWVSIYYVQPDSGASFSALPTSTETVAPGESPPAQPAAQTSQSQPPAAGSATTTTALKLRAGPSEDDEVLTVLPGGTALELHETSANWARVSLANGTSGWVSTCCITESNPPDSAAAQSGAPGDIATELYKLGAPAWAINRDFYNTGTRTREIYLKGLAMGRNPRAFSKMGDCNSRIVFFLSHFDQGAYNLGPYDYLQPTIDHFAGSFSRDSMTVWGGGTSWMVFDPMWANSAYCQPGEMPITCEYRLHNPSFAIVSFGTKEMGHTQLLTENLRAIVEYSIEAGVVPILSTKADSLEGEGQYNNDIIRQTAAEYGVPLLAWGKIAATLPGDGLWDDGHHLGWFPPRYNDSRAYRTGHSARNLAVLITLNAVWQAVQ